MKKYWKTQSGKICVTNLNPKADVEKTKAEIETQLGESVIEIKPSSLPADKTFRAAWVEKDGQVIEDITKAREIHMERIREARNKKLAELDIETLKGNDVQAEKQKLRDIPSTFDLSKAKTIDELKTLWPSELK